MQFISGMISRGNLHENQKLIVSFKAISFFFYRLASNAFPEFRSVGRSDEKNVKRNHKMSENRRLKPQAVPWSLETTRHGHQMDTNSIWQKI